jgi:hypothetical protein
LGPFEILTNLGLDPYYRGPPQIIKLDVECTGEPKVKICPVLMKETVLQG